MNLIFVFRLGGLVAVGILVARGKSVMVDQMLLESRLYGPVLLVVVLLGVVLPFNGDREPRL